MFVGHDLLPTSATVNLIVTFTPPVVRRASGGGRLLHGCQGVAFLKRSNRHEIYPNGVYVFDFYMQNFYSLIFVTFF